MRTLLAIPPKVPAPSFWEVTESFVLVAYANLAASRTLFATTTSLPEFYFRFRRFILLVKVKKMKLYHYHYHLTLSLSLNFIIIIFLNYTIL